MGFVLSFSYYAVSRLKPCHAGLINARKIKEPNQLIVCYRVWCSKLFCCNSARPRSRPRLFTISYSVKNPSSKSSIPLILLIEIHLACSAQLFFWIIITVHLVQNLVFQCTRFHFNQFRHGRSEGVCAHDFLSQFQILLSRQDFVIGHFLSLPKISSSSSSCGGWPLAFCRLFRRCLRQTLRGATTMIV